MDVRRLVLTYLLRYLVSQEQPLRDSASANSTADTIKASPASKLRDDSNSSVYQYFLLVP